jgi:hypothetical protein
MCLGRWGWKYPLLLQQLYCQQEQGQAVQWLQQLHLLLVQHQQPAMVAMALGLHQQQLGQMLLLFQGHQQQVGALGDRQWCPHKELMCHLLVDGQGAQQLLRQQELSQGRERGQGLVKQQLRPVEVKQRPVKHRERLLQGVRQGVVAGLPLCRFWRMWRKGTLGESRVQEHLVCLSPGMPRVRGRLQ